MTEMSVASALAQLGAAGLIGWMWMTERRAASARERQLTEAHRRVCAEGTATTVLVDVVRDNTRAMAALEAGQRRLIEVLGARREAKRESMRGAEDTGGA